MTPNRSLALRSRLISRVRILAVLGLMALSQPIKAQLQTSGRIPPGLWIGDVTLNKVGELQRPATPSATADPLSFLILLHVASNGETHLLKDATVATVTNAGSPIVVVVTDEALPRLRPVISEFGKPLVKRFGSVAYDWASSSPKQLMTLSGGPTRTRYEIEFTTTTNTPTNPFRHPFHPDHQSGIQITRKVRIRLPSEATPAAGPNGVTTLAGDYDEEIGGLTKGATNKLRVWGTILLSRVCDVGVLGLPVQTPSPP